MGAWADRWLELGLEHTNPGMVLHSWVTWYLAENELPGDRTIARFDFPDQPAKSATLWVIFDGDASEVCRLNPGLDEQLIVTTESRVLAEWHLGEAEWDAAVRPGASRSPDIPSSQPPCHPGTAAALGRPGGNEFALAVEARKLAPLVLGHDRHDPVMV